MEQQFESFQISQKMILPRKSRNIWNDDQLQKQRTLSPLQLLDDIQSVYKSQNISESPNNKDFSNKIIDNINPKNSDQQSPRKTFQDFSPKYDKDKKSPRKMFDDIKSVYQQSEIPQTNNQVDSPQKLFEDLLKLNNNFKQKQHSDFDEGQNHQKLSVPQIHIIDGQDEFIKSFGTVLQNDAFKISDDRIQHRKNNSQIFSPEQTSFIKQQDCKHHKKIIQSFCIQCNQELCEDCQQQHSDNFNANDHQIIDFFKVVNYVKQNVLQLKDLIKRFLDNFEDMVLPDFEAEKKQGIEILNRNRNLLIEMVNQHFEGLKQQYNEFYKKIPSHDQLAHIYDSILNINTKLDYFQGKILLKDVKEYIELNLSSNFSSLVTDYEILKEYQFQNHYINTPKIDVNQGYLQKLQYQICDFVNLIGNTEDQQGQVKKINIEMDDYFLPEFETYIPLIDETVNQIILYNPAKKKSETLQLLVDVMPREPSFIITPNLDIFITGGFINDKLSDLLHVCSPLNLIEIQDVSTPIQFGMQMIKKQNMRDPIYQHSLCFIRGCLYIIGGKMQNELASNQCSKYDIDKDQWFMLSPMNYPKTKPSVSSFDDDFIYVFFGNEFEGQSLNTIERYDIQTNQWTLIQPLNICPAYQISNASSIQINKNQILILGFNVIQNQGGIHQCNSNQYITNRSIIFNVQEQNFLNLNSNLPIDYYPKYPLIIQNHTIYGIGHIIKKVDPTLQIYKNGNYLLQILNSKLQVVDIIIN